MVDLGKSNVPLEEDLIKKPIEFVKSWLEFAADNFLQIIRTRGSQGIIFTVPQDKTLFITSAFIDMRNDQTVSSSTVRIFIGATNIAILQINSGGSGGGGIVGIATNSLSYPMPIKVESGQTVEISISNAGGFAGIQGFEIDKRIS